MSRLRNGENKSQIYAYNLSIERNFREEESANDVVIARQRNYRFAVASRFLIAKYL